MKSGFDEPQARFESGSQNARVWTERWVADWMYCPNCGHPQLTQFTANLPVADFFCSACSDQFELKSQKKAFGAKVADGAYGTKIERLSAATNPNLLLLSYDLGRAAVKDVFIVPKHFFVPDIVEKRKPLADTARRAGWVGSNILLGKVPEAGRIFLFRNGTEEPKDAVLAKWQQTLFLRDQGVEARGWLVEVMKVVDIVGRPEFTIEDVYAFEKHLGALYPNNSNVRPKIRQQLQVLRDVGYIQFTSRGHYQRRLDT